jgi:eukaryotic-like serine/threonine-protein kinase
MPPVVTESSQKTVRLRTARSEEARALRGPDAEDPSSSHLVRGPLGQMFAEEDTHVDRYRTVAQLGRGGMGEVSRVRDERIGREIALKSMNQVPPKHLAEATTRFLREARIQALLEHPSIVPVYEIGTDLRGLPFFTMKRVRGRTLLEVMNEHLSKTPAGQIPPIDRRLLRAFVTVCDALEYAHSRGVVHRDLKPDNIMLGRYGEVYVLDWGVAKLLDQSEDEIAEGDQRSTEPGEMVGTPGYMSPEQVVNIDNQVDGRADVFSLGCILFELLAGRSLFPAPSIGEVLQETLSPVRMLPAIPHAPPELVRVVDRATRFRLEERYSSPWELAREVERFLDGDRDLELRTKLAAERATQAKRLAERAISDDPDAERFRAQAMQEAGQALSLVPDQLEARRVILGLFATPPKVLPSEVKKDEETLFARHLKDGLRAQLYRVLAWVPMVPFVFLLGVRMPLLAIGVVALLAIILGGSLLVARRGVTAPTPRLLLFCAILLFGGLLTFAFGPLVFVPGFVAASTMLFVAQTPRRLRVPSIVAGCLTIGLPLALELLGVLPPSMRVGHDELTLLPRLNYFNEGVALITLFGVSLVGIVSPALLAGRMRDELLGAERELLFQRWQLAQLIPRDQSPALS